MKQLAVYFLAVACLVLLLPLPALKIQGGAPSPKPSFASSVKTTTKRVTQTTSLRTTTTQAKEKQTVFLVNDGDKIHTYSETTFLRAVVTCEMPLSYSEEALKAQTVAAYTFFCKQREENENGVISAEQLPSRFMECSTEDGLKTRLGSYYETYLARLDHVIEEVYGYVILYKGAYIEAVYHAINSGVTETGETVWQTNYPYLQSVESVGDTMVESYQKEQIYTPEEVKQAFSNVKNINFTDNLNEWFGKAVCSQTGRVEEMAVGGVAQSGTAIRKALGLRSAHFQISCSDNVFTFTVKGYGHGVGLSQCGAQYMAQQGATWQEILNHYYTGVTIEKEKRA